MTEEFLHYLWKFQNFEKKDLQTEQGEPLNIFKQGFHNHNSGPDFGDARIRIGEQLWAGNVEIHVRSSDWLKHRHQSDEAYSNVILHVVYEHDKEITDKNGQVIPTLVLHNRFDELQYWRYEQLIGTREVIPCASQFTGIDNFLKEGMLERVLVERLEVNSTRILDLWERNNKDWNNTFYQWMARGFGLKINADPMLMLARNLPQSVLGKHKDNLFQLEALLFGVAGFLTEPADEYALQLRKEFDFLRKKYNLPVLEYAIWKYARLRPSSFADVRIGQFAALIHRSENLFSKILGTGSLKILEQLLSDSPSTYWREHFRFGVAHRRSRAGIGEKFRQVLVINVIVPFLFIYGKIKDEPFYRQRALDLLDQLPGEDNHITRIYIQLGQEVPTAYSSQAVIQLYNEYCRPKKCLNCGLGIHLMKQ